MQKPLGNIEIEATTYVAEARSILPNLPTNISLVWDESLIIPGNGTGGTLLKPTTISIGYDPKFKDKPTLSAHLRATILHECFHAVQGWSDQNPTLAPKNLLEDGVLEGAATVFERQYGKTSPPWARYKDDATMHVWLSEIRGHKLNPNSDKYTIYKFGRANGVSWMLYKVGTWITDKALAKNPELSIIDLANKKPQEIIRLAEV